MQFRLLLKFQPQLPQYFPIFSIISLPTFFYLLLPYFTNTKNKPKHMKIEAGEVISMSIAILLYWRWKIHKVNLINSCYGSRFTISHNKTPFQHFNTRKVGKFENFIKGKVKFWFLDFLQIYLNPFLFQILKAFKDFFNSSPNKSKKLIFSKNF